MKERLVGAAVLMAAAIILIPELLSGPDRSDFAGEASAEQSALAPSGETPMKTYTIDLSRPPGAPLAAHVEQGLDAPQDLRDPAPDVVQGEGNPSPPSARATEPALPAQASPDSVADGSATGAQRAPAARTDADAATARGGSGGSAAERPTSRPLAARPSTPTSGTAAARPEASAGAAASTAGAVSAPASGRGWAVQVGSYSKRATAERLAQQLRGQGREAFVMPVQTGGKTLYRVRIGPMGDRASAEAALRSVRAKTPGAAVVVHP